MKYSFAVLCLIQTVAIIAFTIYTEFSKYFLPFGLFLILKCKTTLTVLIEVFVVYMHFKAYRKVIYKDDGRDYVSKKELLAIHVTFSAWHSWITYFCIYTFFRCMNELLNFKDYELKADNDNWQ